MQERTRASGSGKVLPNFLLYGFSLQKTKEGWVLLALPPRLQPCLRFRATQGARQTYQELGDKVLPGSVFLQRADGVDEGQEGVCVVEQVEVQQAESRGALEGIQQEEGPAWVHSLQRIRRGRGHVTTAAASSPPVLPPPSPVLCLQLFRVWFAQRMNG